MVVITRGGQSRLRDYLRKQTNGFRPCWVTRVLPIHVGTCDQQAGCSQALRAGRGLDTYIHHIH